MEAVLTRTGCLSVCNWLPFETNTFLQQRNSSLSSKPVGSVFAVGTSFPVGVESAGSTVTKDELASVRNQRGRKVAGGGCKHGGQPGGGLHADRLLRTPLPLSPGPRTEPWSWGHICGVGSNTVPPTQRRGGLLGRSPKERGERRTRLCLSPRTPRRSHGYCLAAAPQPARQPDPFCMQRRSPRVSEAPRAEGCSAQVSNPCAGLQSPAQKRGGIFFPLQILLRDLGNAMQIA